MLSRLGPAFSLFVLLAGLLAAAAQEPAPAQKAQTPQTSASDAQLPIHTLHVYMDLIQVPVLVLDSEHGRLKPIDPGKFQVSLDSGPKFRPRRVRQQGDDPLSLAILLDPATQPDLMRHLDDAISALAPASLHPEDHVSIYVMDCNLLRTLDEAAADPERLHTAVAEAPAKLERASQGQAAGALREPRASMGFHRLDHASSQHCTRPPRAACHHLRPG